MVLFPEKAGSSLKNQENLCGNSRHSSASKKTTAKTLPKMLQHTRGGMTRPNVPERSDRIKTEDRPSLSATRS